jgi:hypothetical protein
MRFFAVSILVVAACSTPHPTAEPILSPCSELSSYCNSCMQTGPKEQCNQAVAGADDTQCEAVLDDPAVRADCIPSDAAADAPSDVRPPPVCMEAGVPDANCACEKVDAGDAGASTCAPTCAKGGCTFVCEPSATCAASCAGGNCVFECKTGSQCMNSCTGGHCSFVCDVGAVCMDSCSPMTSTCVGP